MNPPTDLAKKYLNSIARSNSAGLGLAWLGLAWLGLAGILELYLKS